MKPVVSHRLSTRAVLLIACFACALQAQNVCAGEQDIGLRYHAYVIGINKHKYNEKSALGWQTLETAENDAKEVGDVLEKEYGFEVRRLIGKYATRASIMGALDELAEFTEKDAVLIYFAGHGHFDKTIGEGFWIPYDAKRKLGAKWAKHDWIWNTITTKMTAVSQARHILIIADACYGGSIFRGGEDGEDVDDKDLSWYLRAASGKSRYAISSGGYERVSDSGAHHSAFAQSVLDHLKFTADPAFCASELAIGIKPKVHQLTGQLVCNAPLSGSVHVGGEFVFIKDPAVFASVASPSPATDLARYRGETAGDIELPGLADSALLAQRGAHRSASALLGRALEENPDSGLAQAVASAVSNRTELGTTDEMTELIRKVSDMSARGEGKVSADDMARPRILACIGPESSGASTESEARAELHRMLLLSAFTEHAKTGFRIVGRDCLEEILREQQLSVSELADPKARLKLRKLLPASLLLLGKTIGSGERERLFLRLIDTQTTELVAVASQSVGGAAAPMAAYDELAKRVVSKAIKERPLILRASLLTDGAVGAGIGRFHGASQGMRFTLLMGDKQTDEDGGAGREIDPEALQVAGVAKLESVGEFRSVFRPEWEDAAESGGGELWLKETQDSAGLR